MTPTRRGALIAGLLYYSTHVTSVVAVIAYGSALSDPATADRVAVTSGVALEVLLALGVVGTGVALLPLLKGAGAASAYAFSALRTLEGAVILAGVLPMLALVALPQASAATVGGALVALHQASFLVGQGLVISVNTLILAALLVRSGLVPRWIGVLGLAGGAVVLASNAGQLFGLVPAGGVVAALAAAPVFAFELSFATCLVARGIGTPAGALAASGR